MLIINDIKTMTVAVKLKYVYLTHNNLITIIKEFKYLKFLKVLNMEYNKTQLYLPNDILHPKSVNLKFYVN